MAQLLFTARSGGVSKGVFESLNLGDHVGDASVAVKVNRKILKSLLSQVDPIYMNQIHGNTVVEVSFNSTSPITADALITREVGLPLAVLSADCLPILINGENVVGVIHAGRKGILNGIIAETISKMRSLGSGKMVALIGPAICNKCYEVDTQMYFDALAMDPSLSTSEQLHCLDLKNSARAQLAGQGVEVVDVDICTAHDPNYFSYRRDGMTGRNAGVIVL